MSPPVVVDPQITDRTEKKRENIVKEAEMHK